MSFEHCFAPCRQECYSTIYTTTDMKNVSVCIQESGYPPSLWLTRIALYGIKVEKRRHIRTGIFGRMLSGEIDVLIEHLMISSGDHVGY